MVNPRELFEEIIPWIQRQRWYPRGVKDWSIVDSWRINEFYMAILKAGRLKLFIPLVLSNRAPQLSPEKVFKFRGYYVYEAEYSLKFFNELIWKNNRIKVCWKLGKVSFDRIKPLTSSYTNTLVILFSGSKRYVYKAYRIISSNNFEPRFLTYLRNRDYVPKVFLTTCLGEYYAGILLEFLDHVADGGYPFYLNARESLKGVKKILDIEIDSVVRTLADFHYIMSRCSHKWCKARNAGEADIEKWFKRILKYYNLALKVFKGESLQLLKEFDLEDVRRRMNIFRSRRILRIHQDFHLGQILYTKEGKFVIIDFEGEIARPNKDRGLLEPAVRDLAGLLRSLGYIAFFALKDHLKTSIEETFNALKGSEGEVVRKWAWKTANSFIERYFKYTSNSSISIHGVSNCDLDEWGLEACKIWRIERSLYEIVYETRFRPNYTYIPLLGLVDYLP